MKITEVIGLPDYIKSQIYSFPLQMVSTWQAPKGRSQKISVFNPTWSCSKYHNLWTSKPIKSDLMACESVLPGLSLGHTSFLSLSEICLRCGNWYFGVPPPKKALLIFWKHVIHHFVLYQNQKNYLGTAMGTGDMAFFTGPGRCIMTNFEKIEQLLGKKLI